MTRPIGFVPVAYGEDAVERVILSERRFDRARPVIGAADDARLSAMVPRCIAAGAPEAERNRWRVVRLDTHAELPGEILSVDCDAGTAAMRVIVRYDVVEGMRKPVYETQTHNFGAGGLALIRR